MSYLNCTVRDIFSPRNGKIIEVIKTDGLKPKFKVWFLDFKTEIWSFNLANRCIDNRIEHLKGKIKKLSMDEQKFIFNKYLLTSQSYIDCITSNIDESTLIDDLLEKFNFRYSYNKHKIVKKLNEIYVDFKKKKKNNEIEVTERDEDLAKSLHSNLNSPTKRNSKRLLWNAEKDDSKFESGSYISSKKARKLADEAVKKLKI